MILRGIQRFFSSAMQQSNKIIWPPSEVLGMKTLDRELFKKNVMLPYVSIQSAEKFQKYLKILKNFYMKMPSFKPVVRLENEQFKIYLDPEKLIKDQIPDSLRIEYEPYELKYNNFDHHDTLRAIIPEDIDSVSGFSTVGHLIHLNLREEALPYKQVIGQVLLDKVQNCRMVVNKLDTIDTQFRYFDMEILAKHDDPELTTVVTTSESKVKFMFDFAKVYWNPRLSSERPRIMKKMLNHVDVLYDVFAGVGPFVLPVSRFLRCRSLANDLNPESYKWLKENVKLNNLEKLVECYNLDGRDFIRNIIKKDLVENYIKKYDGSDCNRKYHVVMNLPDIALEFLDSFSGLLSDVSEDYRINCLHVHCYCFVKGIHEGDERKYVIEEAEKYLGHKIDENDVDEVYNVRKVAPNKSMFRISFVVNQNILYLDEAQEPSAKKMKNNKNSKPNKGNNKNNDKNNNKKNNAAFKVDPSRAQKAKKGKALVKFNKNKTRSMNRDLISQLNDNLNPLQMTVRNGPEPEKKEPFINPARESFEQNMRTEQDIDDAIQQLTDAF